jgi:hypothetical protein
MGDSADGGAEKGIPVNFVPSLSPNRNCSSGISAETVASVQESVQPDEEYRYVELSHPAQLLSGLRDDNTTL